MSETLDQETNVKGERYLSNNFNREGIEVYMEDGELVVHAFYDDRISIGTFKISEADLDFIRGK